MLRPTGHQLAQFWFAVTFHFSLIFCTENSIFYGNAALFRSFQTTRYIPGHSSLNVIDLVELFLLSSTRSEIESYLQPASSQQRYAVDVSSIHGGFFIQSTANEALKNLPEPQPKTLFSFDNKDLLIFSRIKVTRSLSSQTLLVVSSMDYLSSANESMIFYKPMFSLSLAENGIAIEYYNENIKIPVKIMDGKWHSIVLHWTRKDNEDELYFWLDCELIHKGLASQPQVFNSYEWAMSVGSPVLPNFIFIDQPPIFTVRKPFEGLIEQLVVTRDRFFWHSDSQCRYQHETSSMKNNCPICSAPTLFPISPPNSKPKHQQIGKLKIVKQFDTIKEQLDAALRRIEFLERLQSNEQQSDYNSSEPDVNKCFERDGNRYFDVNETWSINNCSEFCRCSEINGKPKPTCSPLRCSPQAVADCPPFPYGGVVWDLAGGCCPRCQRKFSGKESNHHLSGRPCVRWHRSSSVPHGSYFFIKLNSDTCAEKRCIDGRETVVRQGPRSMFCSGCLNNPLVEPSPLRSAQQGQASRRVCCGIETGPCKIRSCVFNASKVCDIPERAMCEDTPEDIICRCRNGYIGDGSKCIDIDECQEPPGTTFSANCSTNDVCINTPGGYYCVAKEIKALPGMTVGLAAFSDMKKRQILRHQATQLKCNETTEMLVQYHSQVSICHCLPGFVKLRPSILMAFSLDFLPHKLLYATNTSLSSSHQKCLDIDECQQVPHLCSSRHNCANIPGSYVCISNTYEAREAHEIKLSANARRSTKNSANRLSPSLVLSFISYMLVAKLFFLNR